MFKIILKRRIVNARIRKTYLNNNYIKNCNKNFLNEKVTVFFIDNKNVSKALLEKVIEIGKKNNLEFIEGPVGFSNMDKAGMLIKGFEKKNTMITIV